MTTRKSYSALRVNQGADSHFIISSIPASTLFACCKISRADEDPEKGYQRLLSETRGKRISNYYNEGNIIPGSIIVSAKKAADLNFNEKSNTISFRVTPEAFLVIDGQHRLYGAHLSGQKIELPVAILTSLELEAEVNYFLDINGEQKGVPRALRLEVEKFLVEEETPEKTRINIVHKLNENLTSPLAGKISMTKSRTGMLSHVPFKSVLEPQLGTALFRDLSFDQKYKLIENFLIATHETLEIMGFEGKLTNAAFFQAIVMALPYIAHATKEQEGDYKVASFIRKLEGIRELDLSLYTGTNKKEIERLSNDIKLSISPNKVDDDLF